MTSESAHIVVLETTDNYRSLMKCPHCSHWNRIEVDKIFVEQPSSEPKVRVMIRMYEPLEAVECKKCGKAIADRSPKQNRETYLKRDND